MEKFWNKDIRRMTIRLLLIMIAGGAFFNLAFLHTYKRAGMRNMKR